MQKLKLESLIKTTFNELLDICLEIDDSLRTLEINTVKKTIIKNGTQKELIKVAICCGKLESLFLLADEFQIELSQKTNKLEDWAYLLDNYLSTKYVVAKPVKNATMINI